MRMEKKDSMSHGRSEGRPIVSDSEPQRLTRRDALGRLLKLAGIATSAWLASPVFGENLGTPSPAQVASQVPLPSYFSTDQKVTVSALVNLIIPDDQVTPGAKAAGVTDYVDYVVSHAPAEEQQAWTVGLRALDEWSEERHRTVFRNLSAAQQDELIQEMASEEQSPRTPRGNFFVRVKRITAEGFYTSKIGLIDDLKYQGNTYVDSPATCEDQSGSKQAETGAHGKDSAKAGTDCTHSHSRGAE